MTEIERKWLVPQAPALDPSSGKRIDQGYLAIQPDGGEARIRRKGGKCFLTVKSAGNMVRAEHEIELTDEQFETLWPATEGRRVEKTRYLIESRIELDVYGGELAGLIVAEVEFDGVAAAERYTPPPWFGEDVTADPRYKNQRLAVDGRPIPG